MRTLLCNFNVLTSFQNPPERRSLLIEEGLIDTVFPSTEGDDRRELSAERYDRKIDGEGRLLVPGLVNAHTHMGMTLLRGYADDMKLDRWLQDWIWPAEEKLTGEEVYWASLLGMIESLRSGVTAFADMYFYMNEVAKATERIGMRGLLSYGIIAEEMDQGGQRELGEALQLAERWGGEGRIEIALSPHAPYTCGDEVLQVVAEEAKTRGLPIHIHLAETAGEVEDSLQKYDMTPARRLEKLGIFESPVLAAHCVHLRGEDFRILSQEDVAVVHNPTSNMKLSSGAAPVDRLLAEGATVALGTDGTASNNNLDMFKEIKLASLLQKLETDDPVSLPAPQAFELATLGGASALGLDQTGKIEEGYRADLVALNTQGPHWTPKHSLTSNLVYSAHATDVEMVMIDGEIVLEGGEILTVDEEEVISRVAELSEKYGKDRS